MNHFPSVLRSSCAEKALNTVTPCFYVRMLSLITLFYAGIW
jgi:hypothetical protein